MNCPLCSKPDAPFTWAKTYCDYCYERLRDERDQKQAASELHVSVGEDIRAQDKA